MIKKNKISVAIASVIFSGFLYAATTEQVIIPFVPGETKVSNGDMVSYNGGCFIAKNNPGVWETPAKGSWFWDEAEECSGEPSPPPSPAPGDVIPFIPGQTLVKNGDIVSYKDECFIAKNNPGKWETPSANSWFWSLTKCPDDVTDPIILPPGSGTPITDPDNPDNRPSDPQVPDIPLVPGKPGDPVILPPGSGTPITDPDNPDNRPSDPQIPDIPLVPGKPGDPVILPPGSGTPITDPDNPDNRPSDPQVPDIPLVPGIPVDPTDPPVGELCDDFNVYPDWTRGDHATKGDIMVHNNIAYEAVYWTQSLPGSDGSWDHHTNCDGTPPGAAPLLSLPNPLDPVRLEVAGWPNTLVVASPGTSAPSTTVVDTVSSGELHDIEKLTASFITLLQASEKVSATSIIIKGDVLDKAIKDKGQSLGTIAVKEALTKAVVETGIRVDLDKINALSDDAKGWANAYNLVISTVASQATFGWSLSIGDFAFNKHSGRQSVWDKASSSMADTLSGFGLYDAKSNYKADFLVYTKSDKTQALNSEQWHNALEHIKQVSDYVQAPAMLADIPTEQATMYFMGSTASERQLRKAAYNNVFAVLFKTDSAELTSKIEEYQNAKVPLYYVGDENHDGPLTVIDELNRQLLAAENVMDNEAFLYETPQSQWVPSTVYKWADFLDGLNAMHNVGVAGNKFWLIDENADDETNIKYAKVAIAAFLAQSMQETIRYNACDENNWSEVRWGAPADYPMSASCGQLGQRYADYGVNPISGLDHAYSCPRDNKMEVSALTHAKWYGAPAPVFAAPDAVLEERGLLKNGSAGRWTNEGHCNQVPETIDTSKQVWERDECKVYVGQKAGKFIWDGSSQESVQGCGWWGRGVIQTTGRQNFGTLNHYLGRSHVDPQTIGKTIDGVRVEAPPANPLYAGLDFCSNPGLICSSEENKEIKWIAGLFYWVTSVQAYPDEGGQYPGWNYFNELKKYVNNGMKGTQFIDDVSGIVNRGCPNLTCDTGEVHNVKERRDNFYKVLRLLGLNPQ